MEDRIMENEQYEIGNPAGKHTCIFCGSNLTILETEWTDFDWSMRPIDKDRTTFQVMCNDCGMAGPIGDTEEEAIDLYYKQSHGVPKLYGLEDIASCTYLFCWLEERIANTGHKWAYPALLVTCDGCSKNAFTGLPLYHTAYGSTWRCWDSKPSDVCSVQTRWIE